MTTVRWLDRIPEEERWRLAGRPWRFRVGDTDYVATMGERSQVPGLCIKKPPGLVDLTVEHLRRFAGSNIVELGISRGGSTALIAQVTQPAKLVAFELEQTPVEPLERFLDEHGLRAVVRPYYGVDQTDRATLARVVEAEFGDQPLDLVTDDASHLLDLTRQSFEFFFPRIRPGGAYIIEDWNWEHVRAHAVADALAGAEPAQRDSFDAQLKERLADRSSAEYAVFEKWFEAQAKDPEGTPPPRLPVRPLSILALELLVARAWSREVVSDLYVTDGWVVVGRGPAELDPDSFRVADIVHDRFGLLPQHG